MKRAGQPSSWIQQSPRVSIDREICFCWRSCTVSSSAVAALKELSRDDALMTRLFVASSHRGSGLAARLFDALFERAHALGYTTIVLDVNRESARAIRFYEKQGMEEFIPVPHPRWLESAPEELQYARYFRKRVGKTGQ